MDDPTVTDPTVDDPTVTDPTVDDPTVDDPTVDDPTVTDPTDALDLLRADLPAHLTVRLPRYVDGVVDPDDLDAAEALIARCDVAAVGERDSGREEVAGMFSSASTDREHSAFVLDGDDLVGYLWIEQDPTAAETWVDVYADPERCTRGIVTAGLSHGLRVGRATHAATAPDRAWTVRSGCFGTDTVLVEGLQAAGFECVRRFYRMRIDLATASLPDVAPPLPDGAVLVNARTDVERRRLYAVQQESFADHWNHTARSYEEYLERLDDNSSDDPDGWWLLEVDGVPAAVCLLDESRADLGDGYVRTLGVGRDFRGRGLAQLLLIRAFLHYRDRGRSGVQLGVDSTSPTGADKLYRRVGMTVTREIDAWSHPL
ncbi:GNAT family N-acetyltransferase [Longivirga aurantiaca]|uniref:GNAT family N-acetyltransferase n=1 Tax=Longivirga aurantiaca TaxID=1837743 RepID=A0ABW1T5I4_9ACTN